jgi:GNAT superfamily N-acetyltransferase
MLAGQAMLHYRKFHNADPPLLAEIWRSRAAKGGLLQPISVDLLEQQVFSKPYFDNQGLILALDEDRPVGFAHGAFGPAESRDTICPAAGVTCMLVVRPDCREAEAAAGLLRHSEDYLQSRGAKVLYGGETWPMAPFYFGLYGGSEPAGVLKSDTILLHLYRSHRYEEVDHRRLFRCRLGSFRPPIGRQQMHWRRKMTVEERVDPPARSWWDACTIGEFELTRFALAPRDGGPQTATATFRIMESPAGTAHDRSAGLIDVEVHPARRREGLGTFLLSEAFRQFGRQGLISIEAQASHGNAAYLALLSKLQMEAVGEGIVFRKDV